MDVNFTAFRQAIRHYFIGYDIYWFMVLALALRIFGRGSSSYGVTGELYRDMEVIFNFLKLGQWPLLGPASSLGGFNFGAVYYYLLAPFVWLFNFAPYGATFVSLLCSVLSVWMLYRLLRLWFSDPVVARLGGLFLAICILDIQNAYYISNPNLVPFFLLWFLFCFTQLLSGRGHWRYYLGLGVSFGIATQLHATALLLLPAILICAFFIVRPKVLWQRLVASGVMAVLFYVPYGVFELSHHFSNTRGLMHLGQKNFGLSIQSGSVLSLGAFWQSWLVSRAAFFDFLALHTVLSVIFLGLMLAGLCRVWAVRHKIGSYGEIMSAISRPGKVLLLLWVGLGAAMFLFFQHAIQTFYFMVLWPAPIICFAWLLSSLRHRQKILATGLGSLFVLAQAVQMCYFYPVVYRPAESHKNLLADFSFIADKAEGQSFNVFNNALDVNQFLYYEKLTGTDSLVSREHANRLFLLCSPEQGVACVASSPGYRIIEAVNKNGLTVKIYQD